MEEVARMGRRTKGGRYFVRMGRCRWPTSLFDGTSCNLHLSFLKNFPGARR